MADYKIPLLKLKMYCNRTQCEKCKIKKECDLLTIYPFYWDETDIVYINNLLNAILEASE